MGLAELGLSRRTEEVSMGRWSGDFATQLDATLFNLTLGGGQNANIKMFFVPGRPLADLRKAPYSLDRFEQFIPIWKELAMTEAMPRQSHMLLDRNGSMLNNGSTLAGGDVWADMTSFDAHVPSPAVPLDTASKGKLVLMPRTESYEKPTLDGLVSYVQGGGNLVMFADAGRRSPDLPGEDWLLLRQLGITAPPSGKAGMQDATPVKGEVFGETAGKFKLRDSWAYTPQQGAMVLATFDDGTPALTRHKVGEGHVYVLWASTMLPPSQGGTLTGCPSTGAPAWPMVRRSGRSFLCTHHGGTPCGACPCPYGPLIGVVAGSNRQFNSDAHAGRRLTYWLGPFSLR